MQLTRLVRGVADRLTTRPRSVSLATLETEVRNALLTVGGERATKDTTGTRA